jgi:hypothetical protein
MHLYWDGIVYVLCILGEQFWSLDLGWYSITAQAMTLANIIVIGFLPVRPTLFN